MSTVSAADRRSSLTIRNAHITELDDVVQVLHLAYGEYIPVPLPQADAEAWHAYWQDIGDVRGRLPVAELMVATLDDRIVGTVTFYQDGTRAGNRGWPVGWAGFRLLGVRPEARGKGIGRALTEECLIRARRCDAAVIGLHTTDKMCVARDMYERMGFQRAPQHDFWPTPDFTVMAYRLTLRAAADRSDCCRLLLPLEVGPTPEKPPDTGIRKIRDDAVSFFQDRSRPRSSAGAEWVRPPTER